MSRADAQAIWQAAVDAVRPAPLVDAAVREEAAIFAAPRVLVVGAGKAGPGMAWGLEAALADRLDRVSGLVNVPEGMTAPLGRIRLHAARPQGVNEPTVAGVTGAEEMLNLLAMAGPEDVAVCLLSGGGSALLPAPATGITLADKLAVTKLLHRSGATIDEMNCVRKHLSRVKGGQLAARFHGKLIVSLIISDVVGDPLDVIASGPTSPDPTTFQDATHILERYGLLERIPSGVSDYLSKSGVDRETPKRPQANVVNKVIGNNHLALNAAKRKAAELKYHVLDLGAFIEGETREVATVAAGIVRSIRTDGVPTSVPTCILIGGETTVTLGESPGKGGRNQEFVLAMLTKLTDMRGVIVLSGGTDGEDGPTDAAGAIADAHTGTLALGQGLVAGEFLRRHAAYDYFEATSGLIKTGLTGTNVMDVRVILIQ
jgi:hydroxypyruvate reductase/glycerate 2-kinase